MRLEVAAARTCEYGCRAWRDHPTVGPRALPRLHSILLDCTIPDTWRPRCRSRDGPHGTKLNPSPSSINAKRPEANNIGFTYYKLARYDEARHHLFIAFKEDKRSGQINSMLVSQVNIAYVYAQTRRPNIGIIWAKRAITTAIACENRFQNARALDALGDALVASQREEDAVEAWRESISLFNRCHAPEAEEVSQKIRRCFGKGAENEQQS